ncbi:Uncharacterised protein [Mycobacterium tuberculosis]|nr:Uncharacterised protein [Mycobacterium tuberculosis]
MSAASRIVVSGVLSSCETSDTKRCCTIESSPSSLICASMLSAIALKERPRVASSSSPCTSSRTPRSPAASRALVSAAWTIGVDTVRSTIQEMAATMATSPMPAIHRVRCTKTRV